MNIIKLGAINSTNDYLKRMCATRHVDNFTFVIAENQTKGRGQMGAAWQVEAGKNLTFSVLVKDLLLEVNQIFHLNVAVAVSIAQILEHYKMPQLNIKWPNDIMADNKKIGGILIENSLKNNGEIYSIIGIGINVNQQNFETLPKASSMAVLCGRNFDVHELMLEIGNKLKFNVSRLRNNDAEGLWQYYDTLLYRKNIPTVFENNGKKFMAMVKGVSQNGNLQLLLEDDSIAEFKIKEVQMLY